ncbi:transporter substrate-binding domain-containing protein [Sneathiella chungangensis]|uniref:Transporter substrate-binding domain-containing protein n=1 Tax=Sneathiella chungangensis TaxID=1418234 RepID=A0A845MLY7_9PROT|nr:transporter substrate-binding domain-containing protein [Sneathiella chungangensis]MZR24342.1 transporter substrate-binding domain-containing protein [Sneathiella chungangensis]
MHKLLKMGALVVVMITMATAAIADGTKSRLEEIKERGYLIVGVTSEAPPFGFIDDKNELVGYEIDVAKLIAKAFFKDENKIEFVKQSFSARWSNIDTGKIDFGIQVTTVYPERLLRVAFTRPYINSGTAVVVRKADGISTIADLNKDGIRAGLITNPQQEERRKRYFPKTTPVTFDGWTPMLLGLRANRVDLIQMDLPQAQWFAATSDDLLVLPGLISEPTYNAIFSKHGDFPLWLALDQLVASMRGGPLYAEYTAIFKKWFGVEPERVSP